MQAGLLPREMEPAVAATGGQPQLSSRPAAAAAPSQPAGSVDQGSKDKREAWEVGQPDYLGNASFDNILKKIDSTMSSPGKGNALIA